MRDDAVLRHALPLDRGLGPNILSKDALSKDADQQTNQPKQ